MSFETLGLSAKVLSSVLTAGYTTPTPIQTQAIPHILARRDVVGIAQTGTGKTAAFVLPMLCQLEQGRARARMPRTLILEPTRELAVQVEESFSKLGTAHKLSIACLIGGVSMEDQSKILLRGADVVIATPGRLLDHFERGNLLLTGISLLVIDEADRMLDMGFVPDIEKICKLVPFTRQTLFFTATMPPEISTIASTFLHDPVRVEVARPASTAKTITQKLVAVSSHQPEKREALRGLLRTAENLQNAIVFCNRKRDVAILHRSLQKHGFNAGALHGDMDQSARLQTLDKFRSGEVTILVASDVAARGLDIPEVSHVYNFDLPTHADDYVHRIGRTGRAGRLGASFSLVSHADKMHLDNIQKLIGQDIEWVGEPLGEQLEKPSREGRGRGRHPERARQAGKNNTVEEKAGGEKAGNERPVREKSPRREPHAKNDRHRSREAGGAKPLVEQSMAFTGSTPSVPRRQYHDRPQPGDYNESEWKDNMPAFLRKPVSPSKS